MKMLTLSLALFLSLEPCALAATDADQPPADAAAAVNSAPTTLAQESDLTLEGSLTLRDPFRKPAIHGIADLSDGGNVPELERYEIEKFKLVGVITGAKKNKAMLTSPNGRMHIISENAVIGTRKGVVKRIANGAVLVEEKTVNLLGQEEKVQTMIKFNDLKLAKKNNGEAP